MTRWTTGFVSGLALALLGTHEVRAAEAPAQAASVELVPGVFDGTGTLGAAATLDWQLL